MNQILGNKTKNNEPNKINQRNLSFFNKKSFFIQFIFCIILALILIFYYVYLKYTQNKKESISKQLVDYLGITSLYSTNNNYTSSLMSTQNFKETNDNKFDIIGMIEIKKIGINYPILSKITDEFLDIAPCRAAGPMPNENGNLCIAAHNYNNFKHFSKLNQLNSNDIISIYDLNGNKIDYLVYSKYEVDATDTDCMSQNTNNYKEITLITCNNLNSKRIIIKAKEKE